MTYIDNIDEINKLMRQEIINQGDLNPDLVINSLSLYGVELQKKLNSAVYGPIESSDCLVLFELTTNNNSNNQNFTEDENGKIIVYRSFTMHFIIYGNNSLNLASLLSSRFRTMNVIEKMYNKGINIENISNPESANEFINSKLWMRTDFRINLSVSLKLNQVEEDKFANLPGLIYIVEK